MITVIEKLWYVEQWSSYKMFEVDVLPEDWCIWDQVWFWVVDWKNLLEVDELIDDEIKEELVNIMGYKNADIVIKNISSRF